MSNRSSIMNNLIINNEAQLASIIGLFIIIAQPVAEKSVPKL